MPHSAGLGRDESFEPDGVAPEGLLVVPDGAAGEVGQREGEGALRGERGEVGPPGDRAGSVAGDGVGATAADGRTVAGADFAITNGIGYDAWSDKLLAANPASSRTALKVGDLLGKKEGDNPHQWYSAESVTKVIDQITADYKKIDPADAAYFDQQKTTFTTKTLARYNQLEADIKARYASTPIGASESIVTPLSESLGLKMLTPETFLDAMSEGTDPTAADKATIDQQISGKQIKVYVYNSQNSTPDVAAQVDAAKKQGIPVATVTETLAPANATFQDWQTQQLQGIADALKAATGK
ncbi:ABC transporter substrate-binding protein [Kitasatospora aureofaciens]|nr:ABC transporter substrate-binding protein [Kitasatospora aureofaciens]